MRFADKLFQKFSIVICLLLFCAIYIPYLSRTIEYDEAVTYFEYAPSPIRALFAYTAPNNHILHSFLVWLSTTFIGDSLIAIRLPAFMAALLSAAYLYRIGRKLKDHNTGLLAAVLLAAIPLFINYIPNARGYSLCVLLSLIFFDLIYFGPIFLNRTKQRLLMLNSALLVMTLPTTLLFVGSLTGWLVIRSILKYERRILPLYVLPILVGSLIGSLFYSYGFISGGVGSFSNQFGYTSIFSLASEIIRQLKTGYTAPILLAGAFIGIGFSWVQYRRLLSALTAIILFAALLAVLQKGLTGHVLFPRNYVYITPFFALLVAIGWANALTLLPRNHLITAVFAISILGMVAHDAQYLDRATPVDTFQTAIEKHAHETDLIIAGCCLEYPAYYINRDTSLFTLSDATERFIIVPTNYSSFETLSRMLPETVICEQGQWNDLDIYTCPIVSGGH